MSIALKIDGEIADEITRQNLLDSLRMLTAEVESLGERLNRDGFLPEHNMIDLHDAKKHRKALRRVLRYFSTQGQWASYNI